MVVAKVHVELQCVKLCVNHAFRIAMKSTVYNYITFIRPWYKSIN